MERRRLLLLPLGVATARRSTPVTGSLLVATSKATDPDFVGVEVLLIYADRDAAIGVVINRGSNGGPVPVGVTTLLESAPGGNVRSRRVMPGVWVVSDPKFTVPSGVRAVTLRGTCGWTMKELMDEVDAGKWRVTTTSASHVFRTVT